MAVKTKILLAEDEPSLGLIIKESLETRGYHIVHCRDGKEAAESYYKEKPELLILDVMMPKKDGFTLAREVRMQDAHTPIIFLTAKSQTRDVVEGFSTGGNDYLKKPFSMEELIVRIENLLNKKKNLTINGAVQIGNYLFDFKKQTLKYKKEEKQSLTHREANLLFHLNNNKNSVLDRSIILKKLWGDDDFFNARSMDVFITKLRKKLKKDPNIQILNVRGYGYKLIC
mgnify:CR=1 FL=1